MRGLALAMLFAVTPAVADMPRCNGALNGDFAKAFAADWIAAWNSHDLARILSRYADDFEMRSPGIVSMGEPSGVLQGKEKVGAYWMAALKAQPDLKFDLLDVDAGVMSLAVHYRNQTGRLNTEVLEFGGDCHVARGSAHRMP